MYRYLVFAFALTVASSEAAMVRILAWDHPTAARKLALVSGGNPVGITGMHPLKRTAPMKFAAGGAVAIRALDKPPGPDGKALETAVAIPQEVTHPLLLLIPDEAKPTGLRALVIDDNPANFRWGVFRFFNATTTELAISLDSKAVRVPAGWKPIDLDLGGEKRGIGVVVAASADLKKPLYSAVWEYDKDTRTLVFMVAGSDPRLSPVHFKAIPEDRRDLELDAAAGRKADETPQGR